MNERMLEQEYKKLKQQAAPDLWSRIEMNLAEHPERAEREAVTAEGPEKPAVRPAATDRPAATARPEATARPAATDPGERRKSVRRIPAWRPAYGMAAAAALVVVTVFANRQAGSKSMAPDMMMQETMAAAEAAPMEAGPVDSGGTYAGTGALTGSTAENGVLSWQDLDLAAYRPLPVPDQAVTVPADSAYFSEAILGDTGLLCGGTVTEVSFEQDEAGRAVKVVYEISLDRVYYSEDYTSGIESLTVKSPIVETEGDETYILYQLQAGGTYLLPLAKRDGVWELLYPFAPQIQVTGDGAYLFHSGYASLAGSDASVVIGNRQGAGDYYYDRMLLRDDDNFLSDLISLVEREAQGRK